MNNILKILWKESMQGIFFSYRFKEYTVQEDNMFDNIPGKMHTKMVF